MVNLHLLKCFHRVVLEQVLVVRNRKSLVDRLCIHSNRCYVGWDLTKCLLSSVGVPDAGLDSVPVPFNLSHGRPVATLVMAAWKIENRPDSGADKAGRGLSAIHHGVGAAIQYIACKHDAAGMGTERLEPI
ncbi:hypothetical protein MCOR02_004290 [Pyricularia oryzae]|nr:hypothetical protein MCOR02_004290 [Pyricularia oryzae]